MEGADSYASLETRENILISIPQQPPFRFIDSILELSEDHCIGQYFFKKTEFFYEGHFPGNPITPGVILTECMAQIGLIPITFYLAKRSGINSKMVTFLAETDIEFLEVVPPETLVTVKSNKTFFRRNKIKADVNIELQGNKIAARGSMSGIGIINETK